MLRNCSTGRTQKRIASLLPLMCLPLSTLITSCFYFHAAANQLSLINDQTPLADTIQEETDPERRLLLKQVRPLLSFADNVMQMDPGSSYRGYVDLGRRGLTYVLSAAEKTRLEPYRWWFPIAGDVEYKSFFDSTAAQEEERRLAAQGYDTYLGQSQAYSTLGYLRDPITNTMLAHGFAYFVEVLLHELAHRTLYVAGRTEFNEQLASFVAQQGTRQFLALPRFSDTGFLPNYERTQARKAKLEQRLSEVRDQLEALYDSDLSEAAKLEAREPLFARAREAQAALPWLVPITNNATLLQALRYREHAPELERLWSQCKHSWVCFWAVVEQQVTAGAL